jgi:antitoxin VapB
MPLNIKNRDVEELLEQVVQMTGETKTEAVRKALEQRRQRLALRAGMLQDDVRLLAFLQDEVWPQIPVELLRGRLTSEEEDQLLGYGEHGI